MVLKWVQAEGCKDQVSKTEMYMNICTVKYLLHFDNNISCQKGNHNVKAYMVFKFMQVYPC